jgi:hypothetical protein
MLATQRSVSGGDEGQGCLSSALAELQQAPAATSHDDRLRQRLLVLTRRLRKVQALGGECARVDFSEHVWASMGARASATA